MNEEITRIQESLLALLPLWNYKITKPFKQLLNEEISLEMYYCIQTLQWAGEPMSMTELTQFMRMPKQQMTKLVGRLVEGGFVRRIYDAADRRVIRLSVTDKAEEYIAKYLTEDAGYFRKLMEEMTEEDREDFRGAVETLIRVLAKETCGVEE